MRSWPPALPFAREALRRRELAVDAMLAAQAEAIQWHEFAGECIDAALVQAREKLEAMRREGMAVPEFAERPEDDLSVWELP